MRRSLLENAIVFGTWYWRNLWRGRKDFLMQSLMAPGLFAKKVSGVAAPICLFKNLGRVCPMWRRLLSIFLPPRPRLILHLPIISLDRDLTASRLLSAGVFIMK